MQTQLDIKPLLSGSLSDAEAAQFLLALQPQDVSCDAFGAIVDQLLLTSAPEYFKLAEYAENVIDCCGTGGSGLPRFNTSTAVAIVLAAAGQKVAKFGNRAASGRTGSFDVLEQLGLASPVSAAAAERLLESCNLAFLFAPQVYPVLARLAPIRKSLAVPTVFNFAGPLLNPTRPKRRLLGVSSSLMQQRIGEYLTLRAETKRAFVVRAHCGLDDLCPGCGGDLLVVGATPSPNVPRCTNVCPHETSAMPYGPGDSAGAMMAIFDGQDSQSPFYHLVALNAALSMVATGSVDALDEARQMIAALLNSGVVMSHLLKIQESYARIVG